MVLFLAKRLRPPPYVGGVDAITIEHLMTHTAGGWQNDGRDPMFHHPEMNQHDIIKWTIGNQPLTRYAGYELCLL